MFLKVSLDGLELIQELCVRIHEGDVDVESRDEFLDFRPFCGRVGLETC